MKAIRLPAAVADDELLAMRPQLEMIAAELTTVRRWLDEVGELYEAEIERSATWPEDQRQWQWWDAQAHCDACRRIEEETELGMSFVRATDAEMALYDKIDPLCHRIKSIVPRTPEGRSLKRWALQITSGNEPISPPN
jgi:hypothetical protein